MKIHDPAPTDRSKSVRREVETCPAHPRAAVKLHKVSTTFLEPLHKPPSSVQYIGLRGEGIGGGLEAVALDVRKMPGVACK